MKYPGYWIMGGLGGKHCRETKVEQWARSTFLVGNLDDVGGRLGSDPGDPSTGSATPISIGVRTFLDLSPTALFSTVSRGSRHDFRRWPQSLPNQKGAIVLSRHFACGRMGRWTGGQDC